MHDNKYVIFIEESHSHLKSKSSNSHKHNLDIAEFQFRTSIMIKLKYHRISTFFMFRYTYGMGQTLQHKNHKDQRNIIQIILAFIIFSKILSDEHVKCIHLQLRIQFLSSFSFKVKR